MRELREGWRFDSNGQRAFIYTLICLNNFTLIIIIVILMMWEVWFSLYFFCLELVIVGVWANSPHSSQTSVCDRHIRWGVEKHSKNFNELTQRPVPREHEWWIANCCSARNRSTLGSCRSKSSHERCCVNRSRCFSRCQNPPTDPTIRDHTLDHMPVVLWNDRAFEYHPSPEFLATIHRARTRIADSLMQLMANNRKHPCTHRTLALNI